MKPADRLAKYYRYKKLDPDGRYGIKGQYLSILDPKPHLVPWVEGDCPLSKGVEKIEKPPGLTGG